MAYHISPRFGASAFLPGPAAAGQHRRAADEPPADPVTDHLLLETALGDSRRFDVLPVDAAEALRAEQQALAARLAAAGKKLAAETKLRDAMRSLGRLHTAGSDAAALATSDAKTEALMRDVLGLEAQMRSIDMRLLMHTAAVLQRAHAAALAAPARPHSPASLHGGLDGDDVTAFDPRSYYRSPENLDMLMHALQTGAHHRTPSDAPPAAAARLERLNHQLHAVLHAPDTDLADIQLPPSPPTGASTADQLDYLEDAVYSLEQRQHTRASAGSSPSGEGGKAADYEATLTSLWQSMLAGEEEARERKRERRRLLADDDDAHDQLSPDDDYDTSETFSLAAFSAKVQWLFRRATTLKDKQSVLLRQIKQQRELNSKSDAQREADFDRLNAQLMSARADKMAIEDELDHAMQQLQQVDLAQSDADTHALQAAHDRNAGLEAQLVNVRERMAGLEAERDEARQRAAAYEAQLKDVQERVVALQKQAETAEQRCAQYETDLHGHQERSATLDVQSREVEARSTAYEAQVRDAQERALSLEQTLRRVQDEARTLEARLREAEGDAGVEAVAVQAELSEAQSRMAHLTASLQAATAAKEAAEARSLDATNSLNAKEEELRALEGEIVRLTTELTMAKAELDGAYGTRAQRAAASAADPAIKRELDDLTEKNNTLTDQLSALAKLQDAASQSEAEARQAERSLKAELSAMAAEYEALTRDAIANEKDRDALEAQIDRLRDEREALERDLSDEKVKMLGVRSPGAGPTQAGQVPLDLGATSIRMLREDFRKMMRERTAEGLRALRAEQDERRKLEAVVRQLRKEGTALKAGVLRGGNAAPATPTPPTAVAPTTTMTTTTTIPTR